MESRILKSAITLAVLAAFRLSAVGNDAIVWKGADLADGIKKSGMTLYLNGNASAADGAVTIGSSAPVYIETGFTGSSANAGTELTLVVTMENVNTAQYGGMFTFSSDEQPDSIGLESYYSFGTYYGLCGVRNSAYFSDWQNFAKYPTDGLSHKIGFAYAGPESGVGTGGYRGCIVAVDATTLGSCPSLVNEGQCMTRINIGGYQNSLILSGAKITRIAVYTRALTQTELQTVTGEEEDPDPEPEEPAYDEEVLASFYGFDDLVSSNYTATLGGNAVTDGSVTIASGAIRLTSGETWTGTDVGISVLVKYSGFFQPDGNAALVTFKNTQAGSMDSGVGVSSVATTAKLQGIWQGKVWTTQACDNSLAASGYLVMAYQGGVGTTLYDGSGNILYQAPKLVSSKSQDIGDVVTIGGLGDNSLLATGWVVEGVRLFKGALSADEIAAAVADFEADFPEPEPEEELSQMYLNRLSGEEVVPAAKYGKITVPGDGFKATAFETLTTLSKVAAEDEIEGSYANVIVDGTQINTHTFAGWFRVGALPSGSDLKTLYLAKSCNSDHNGYKVAVNAAGQLLIGKTNYDGGKHSWNGTALATTETVVTTNVWFHLAVANTYVLSGSSKTVTPVVYVNGSALSLTGTFYANLNGNSCTDLMIGAGVAAAGIFVDNSALATSGAIAAIALSAPQAHVAPASVPAKDFTYEPKAGAVPTGWITGWSGEAFTKAGQFRLGPDGECVSVVTSSQHPYAGLAAKSGYTMALYADISQVERDKTGRFLLDLGNKNVGVNQGLLMTQSGNVQLYQANKTTVQYNSVATTTPPTAGYHLYVWTQSATDGATLYVDGVKIGTEPYMTSATSGGFQIGNMYGGVWNSNYSQGVGMAVAGVYGWGQALSDEQVALLAESYPPVTGITATSVDSSISGTLNLVKGDSIAAGAYACAIAVADGATVDLLYDGEITKGLQILSASSLSVTEATFTINGESLPAGLAIDAVNGKLVIDSVKMATYLNPYAVRDGDAIKVSCNAEADQAQAAQAYDGDASTYFEPGAAANANGVSWTGIEFTNGVIVTRIAYSGNKVKRLIGGAFQGANLADFSDAVNLHVVEEYAGGTADVTLDEAKGPFNYLRFMGMYGGNVKEIRFYGLANSGTVAPTNAPTVVSSWSTDGVAGLTVRGDAAIPQVFLVQRAMADFCEDDDYETCASLAPQLGETATWNDSAATGYSKYRVKGFNACGSSPWTYFEIVPEKHIVGAAKPSFGGDLPGFYADKAVVTISYPVAGAKIYYTTDGSTPTTNSTLYADAITLTDACGKTNALTHIRPNPVNVTDSGYVWKEPTEDQPNVNVIRARAFLDDGSASSGDVAGTWLVGPTANEHTLRVISIQTDADNFFGDPKGILVPGDIFNAKGWPGGTVGSPNANYFQSGDAWERPAQLEIFDTDRTEMLAAPIGTRVRGNWSRAAAKKSLTCYFRKEYGQKNAKIQLFGDEGKMKFKRFIVRNGGNDWYKFGYRDAVGQSLFRGYVSTGTQGFEPGVLYINGEYWGLYNLRHCYSKHHFEEWNDSVGDDIDYVKMSPDDGNHFEVQEGDLNEMWNIMQYLVTHTTDDGTLDDAEYAHVESQIDIADMIDYYIVNVYLGNNDWNGNNMGYWRNRSGDDTRWHFTVYDCDSAMSFGGDSYSTDHIQVARNANDTDESATRMVPGFLKRCFYNADFKKRFANRYADLLNTALKPDRTTNILSRVAETVRPELVRNIARWTNIGSEAKWDSQLATVTKFFTQRPDKVFTHLLNHCSTGSVVWVSVAKSGNGTVKINTVTSDTEFKLPFSGRYFSDIPVTLTATPAAGYEFAGWQIDGGQGADRPTGESTISLLPSEGLSIEAVFTEIETQPEIVLTGVYDTATNFTMEADTIFIVSNASFAAGVTFSGDFAATIRLPEGTTNASPSLASSGDLVIDGDGRLTVTGERELLNVGGDIIVRGGELVINATIAKAKTSAVLMKGNFRQTGGRVTLNMDGAEKGYGFRWDDQKGFTAEVTGGAFVANLASGEGSVAFKSNKGSNDFTVGGGSLTAHLDAADARVADVAGNIKFEGNAVIRVTTSETATHARVFKTEKKITITDTVDIDVKALGAESEAFCADNLISVKGGVTRVDAGDDCFSAQTNIVISGGVVYGHSVSNDVFDSNGQMEISGGTVVAYALAEGHAAFDTEPSEPDGLDHTFTLSGGRVVGLGGKGSAWPAACEEKVECCKLKVESDWAAYSNRYLVAEGEGEKFYAKLPAIADPFILLAAVKGLTAQPTTDDQLPATVDDPVAEDVPAWVEAKSPQQSLRFYAIYGNTADGDEGDTGEFIVITNVSDSATIDLTGVAFNLWKLSDKSDYEAATTEKKKAKYVSKCNFTITAEIAAAKGLTALAAGASVKLNQEDFTSSGWTKITNGDLYISITDAEGLLAQEGTTSNGFYPECDGKGAYLIAKTFGKTIATTQDDWRPSFVWYTFATDGTSSTLTGICGDLANEAEIELPKKIGGVALAAIADGAFKGCANLRYLVFPAGPLACTAAAFPEGTIGVYDPEEAGWSEAIVGNRWNGLVMMTGHEETISVNIAAGYPVSGSDEHGLMGVAGDQWLNVTGTWSSETTKTIGAGAVTSVVDGVAIARTNVVITAAAKNTYAYKAANQEQFFKGYLDDGGDHARITVTGLQYTEYDVIVYATSDTAGYVLDPVTVNGVSYTWQDGATVEGTSLWGATRALAPKLGQNALWIPGLTDSQLSIVGGSNASSARGCIAAIQIVCRGRFNDDKADIEKDPAALTWTVDTTKNDYAFTAEDRTELFATNWLVTLKSDSRYSASLDFASRGKVQPAHYVIESGTHELVWVNGNANINFTTDATAENPSILVKDGATLNFTVRDFTGWEGAATNKSGNVVRVNGGGTLNLLPSGTSTHYYQGRYWLDPGATVNVSFASAQFRLNGGAVEGFEQLYVPDVEEKAKGEGEGEGTAVMTFDKDLRLASDATAGVGVYVGSNATLRLDADITSGNATPTLGKWGAGTLEITGSLANFTGTLAVHAGRVALAENELGGALVADGDAIVDVAYAGVPGTDRPSDGAVIIKAASIDLAEGAVLCVNGEPVDLSNVHYESGAFGSGVSIRMGRAPSTTLLNAIAVKDGETLKVSCNTNAAAGTATKAYDGDTSTYFTPGDAANAAGVSWTGLEFTNDVIVTRIAYVGNSARRMIGGAFQGANCADFSDATNICVVEDYDGGTVDVTLDEAKGPYRYLRFVGMYGGNVKEIAYYGLADTGAVAPTNKPEVVAFWSTNGVAGLTLRADAAIPQVYLVQRAMADFCEDDSDYETCVTLAPQLGATTTWIDGEATGYAKYRVIGLNAKGRSEGTYFELEPEKLIAEGPDKPTFGGDLPGFYAAEASVTIDYACEGATVYYTTDGSTPTTNSTRYTGAIALGDACAQANPLSKIRTNPPEMVSAQGKAYAWYEPSGDQPNVNVIRARAFLPDGSASKYEVAGTWMIGPTVGEARTNGLRVVSIITDADNYFGDEKGIMVPGDLYNDNGWVSGQVGQPNANYFQKGQAWERPAFIEMFDETGAEMFSVKMGTRVHGNWSRASAKKTLVCYSRKELGAKNIKLDKKKFKMFNDEPDRNKFKRLSIRNGGNDWYKLCLRDAVGQSMFRGYVNTGTQGYEPLVAYVNGEYWGVYNLRHAYSKQHFEEWNGAVEDDIDYVKLDPDSGKHFEIQEGDALAMWNLMQYMIQATQDSEMDDAEFAVVSNQVDIDDMMDFHIVNIFLGNNDWMSNGNNMGFWRSRSGADRKWHFTVYDCDSAMGFDGKTGEGDHLNTALNVNDTNDGAGKMAPGFLKRCFYNAGFKQRFANRFADLMNTALRAERATNLVMRAAARIEPEIPRMAARWTNMESLAKWQERLATFRAFFQNRPDYMFGYVNTHCAGGELAEIAVATNGLGTVRVNTVESGTHFDLPYSGRYFTDIPITLTATPAAGYEFVGWRVGADVLGSPTLTLTPTNGVTYTACFEPLAGANPQQALRLVEIYGSTNVEIDPDGDTGEFVIVTNTSGQAVNLNGMTLTSVNRKKSETSLAFTVGVDAVVPACGFYKFEQAAWWPGQKISNGKILMTITDSENVVIQTATTEFTGDADGKGASLVAQNLDNPCDDWLPGPIHDLPPAPPPEPEPEPGEGVISGEFPDGTNITLAAATVLKFGNATFGGPLVIGGAAATLEMQSNATARIPSISAKGVALAIDGAGTLVLSNDATLVSCAGLTVTNGTLAMTFTGTEAKSFAVELTKSYVQWGGAVTLDLVSPSQVYGFYSDTKNVLAEIHGGTFATTIDGGDSSATFKMKKGSNDVLFDGGDITVRLAGVAPRFVNTDGKLDLAGADIDIATVGGAVTSRVFKSVKTMTVSGGTITARASGAGSEVFSADDKIRVKGGVVYVESDDDAFSAATNITISAGKVQVLSKCGDGIDSNGDVAISGGYVLANALAEGCEGIEADGKLLITGGTVVAVGYDGMIHLPDAGSVFCCTNAAVSYDKNARYVEVAGTNDANKIVTTVNLKDKCAKTFSLIATCPGFIGTVSYTGVKPDKDLAYIDKLDDALDGAFVTTLDIVRPGETPEMEAETEEEAREEIKKYEPTLTKEDVEAGVEKEMLRMEAVAVTNGTGAVTGYRAVVAVNPEVVPAPAVGEDPAGEIEPIVVTPDGEGRTEVSVGIVNAVRGLWYGYEVSEALGQDFVNDVPSFRRATDGAISITGSKRSGGAAFFRVKVLPSKPTDTRQN